MPFFRRWEQKGGDLNSNLCRRDTVHGEVRSLLQNSKVGQGNSFQVLVPLRGLENFFKHNELIISVFYIFKAANLTLNCCLFKAVLKEDVICTSRATAWTTN